VCRLCTKLREQGQVVKMVPPLPFRGQVNINHVVRPRDETNKPRQQKHGPLQPRVGLGERDRPRRQQPHSDNQQRDGGQHHPPILPHFGVPQTRPLHVLLARVVVAVLDERVAVSRRVVGDLVAPESERSDRPGSRGHSPSVVDAHVHLGRARRGGARRGGPVDLDRLVGLLLEGVVDREALLLSLV
jgi:hypothetical protein